LPRVHEDFGDRQIALAVQM